MRLEGKKKTIHTQRSQEDISARPSRERWNGGGKVSEALKRILYRVILLVSPRCLRYVFGYFFPAEGNRLTEGGDETLEERPAEEVAVL